MTEEKFFKWATTRWYFYVIVLLDFIYHNSPLDELGSKLKLEPVVILGSVLGSFVISFIITTFIYFIEPYIYKWLKQLKEESLQTNNHKDDGSNF